MLLATAVLLAMGGFAQAAMALDQHGSCLKCICSINAK
jgi:hypothetical protein